MKSSKPLKRNENLVWLSRDHHQGLLLIWKTRQGLNNGTSLRDIASYVHFFWMHALEPHFRDEERLLFPVLSQDDAKRCLAAAQHAYIQRLVEIMMEDREMLCNAVFQEFGEMLERHIRFEERVLFPYIEQKIGGEQLNHIGWQLEQSHAVNFKDEWHHEFWKTPG